MTIIEPQLVQMEGFTVSGLSVRTKNEDEFNLKTAKIPQLWAQLDTDLIPHQKQNSPVYGVYADYESDHNGCYTLTVGVEVMKADKLFAHVDVKKANYLVFKNSGSMPQAIIATWQMVWDYFDSQTDFVRAYGTDFEVYLGPEKCEVYIQILNKSLVGLIAHSRQAKK